MSAETRVASKAKPQDIEPKPPLEEVKAAIKIIKARKSPGLKNIPSELIM